MSLPVKTGLPDNLIIGDGYVIKFRAVDPTTGADVSGVKVSKVTVQATPTVTTDTLEDLGPLRLVPGPGA